MRFFIFFISFISMALAKPAEYKPVVEGELIGQLGNQMFIIATTVSYGLEHGLEPIFPTLLSEKGNNVPINYKHLFYHLEARKEPIQKIYKEPTANYREIPYFPNVRLSGYFQSEKYFIKHKEEILELFQPSEEIVSYLREKYASIMDDPLAVSIHLRSYRKEDPRQKIYVQYDREYIEKAIKQFPKDSTFVVFSNDMKWCKKELSGLERKFIFIEGNAHYHDLYLMSFCKHNIISNSSFSWWGAYLNKNPEKKVIAPRCWYTKKCGIKEKDLVPDGWVRI